MIIQGLFLLFLHKNKYTLWVLIRIAADSNEYQQHTIFMENYRKLSPNTLVLFNIVKLRQAI